jgi:hypothetical protein
MFYKDNLSNEELFNCLHECAVKYERIVGKSYMFVNFSQRIDKFISYEVNFQPFQFMHLVGINSKTMGALSFYKACLSSPIEITLKDCTPAYNHSRKEICSKVIALYDLLDLAKAKYFLVGNKDKIREKVDFDFAYGKNAILGCVKTGKKKIPYPITCINKNIEEFCTTPHRITFILSKNDANDKYTDIFYEIKKGLTKELINYHSFPIEILNQIDHI